jgi:putative transposon-encoded protein
MSQTGQEEIEYDLQGAKIFAILINHLRDKVQVQRKQVEMQHVIMYSLKSRVKKFGKSAEDAAVKEMQQMIDQECFEPIN